MKSIRDTMNFSEIGARENAARHMCVCSPDEPCRIRHKTRNLQQAIYHVEVRFEEFDDFAQRRNHPSGTATRMICHEFFHVLSKTMFFLHASANEGNIERIR